MMLALHIVSAGISAIVVCVSLYALMGKRSWAQRLMSPLMILTVLDIVSGSFLSVMNVQSPRVYCQQMGLYLVILLGTQYALYQVEGKRSHTLALSMGANLSLFAITLFLL